MTSLGKSDGNGRKGRVFRSVHHLSHPPLPTMPVPTALVRALAAPAPATAPVPAPVAGVRRPAEDEIQRDGRIAQDALVVYAKANGKRARLEQPAMSRLLGFVKVSAS
jgi:hypothetical protein